MPDRLIAPYGSWKSPITAELIAGGSVVLSQPSLEGGDIYWIEMRPAEAGSAVIVRRDAQGETVDINPVPFNARTRVHEYGGGDYTVHERSVFFANFADQRLYLASDGAEPRPVTAPSDLRYADPLYDPQRNRLICIQEDHSSGGQESASSLVTNSLVSVSLDLLGSQPLASGNDFYSSPRLSPDGEKLAWLS